MRTRVVAGNWKMNTYPNEATKLVHEIVGDTQTQKAVAAGVRVVIFPPYTSLFAALESTMGHGISVGAQNCHHEGPGAYTGEISAEVLSAIGCSYVIVGHSERRRDQGESNVLIGRKAVHAITNSLTPIICIGETLQERQADATTDVIRKQLSEIIAVVGPDVMQQCVVAYEPVWAIGTGLAATPEQAQQVHALVRHELQSIGAQDVSILYGGSVTDANAEVLFGCDDIDGALVGGASLRASSFVSIVAAASLRAGI